MVEDAALAKEALDKLIKKSRVHFYKPIQIAEILHYHRTAGDFSLLDLESYRNRSKKWRDIICMQFLGRVSTSSAKFQDNLFEDNAIPPAILNILGVENKRTNGAVEAYIYQRFAEKHSQLETALNYCLNNTANDFDLTIFLSQFQQQAGLKRSLDKIFEIVIYALFEVITTAIDVKIDIYYPDSHKAILQEFANFADKVLNLSEEQTRKTLSAHFHRVGVTNAADRGLDMYANFGSVVQVKHLSLDEDLAKDVVTTITSERIILVCKDAEEKLISSLLSQIGWQSRLQAIITINELSLWYDKALRGKYATQLGQKILDTLAKEIKQEFPSVGNNDFTEFQQNRGYDKVCYSDW